MNKREAKELFVGTYLAGITKGDGPMLAEAWNNFTDSLCKDGQITSRQYSTWTHPVFTKSDWERSKG